MDGMIMLHRWLSKELITSLPIIKMIMLHFIMTVIPMDILKASGQVLIMATS